MKVCSICQNNKSEEEYNFKDKEKGIRQRACKLCTRQQVRNHYLNNKDYYLRKTRIRNRQIRQMVREYIWDYLSDHSCVDCGESDPVVLEFDHQYDKKIHISHMAQNNSSIEEVAKEISKCQVRCANCHRRKTSIELGWYKK